jgi:hypothetical protein
MGKKSIPTPAPEEPDLNSLLGSLGKAKPAKKKDEYEYLSGFEKEVDQYLKDAEVLAAIEAKINLQKSAFKEIGKKHNIKTKTTKTVALAGTGDNKVLYIPTDKYSGIPMKNDKDEPNELVEAIQKLCPKEQFPRWFKAAVSIAVDVDDQKRLAEFIDYNIKGGFGDMLMVKHLLYAQTPWHLEKYGSGLKEAIVAYIDSLCKPVDTLKVGAVKK